jgi:hypothetical protein
MISASALVSPDGKRMTWSIFSVRSDLELGARLSAWLHSSPRWSGASHKAAESKHPSRFGKFDLLLAESRIRSDDERSIPGSVPFE